MKILQGLIAIIALMMTLQVSASTVPYSHKESNTASAHRSHAFISDLFGSLEAGESTHDTSRAKLSRISKGRRGSQISRFRSLQDISMFFRSTGNRETPRLIRERGLNRPGDFIGISDNVNISAITNAPSAVPVPAAVWLFGSGLAGLFAFSYRRQA